MVLSALQALYTERFSVSQAVSLSNSALNVLKLLLRSVCQTSRHPSGKVMGLSPYFGRLRGQQGLVGCNLLATQSLLFMQGLWAVKDTGICMYEVSSPFGFKYRYAEGCLCFLFFILICSVRYLTCSTSSPGFCESSHTSCVILLRVIHGCSSHYFVRQHSRIVSLKYSNSVYYSLDTAGDERAANRRSVSGRHSQPFFLRKWILSIL